MPNADDAGPSSKTHFDATNTSITSGRDVASHNNNITGHNNVLTQNFHGYSGTKHTASQPQSVPIPVPDHPDRVDRVLSWLGPHAADYFPAHEEARSRRAPGTGKWFFDTDIYTKWATKEIIELRNVECTGIPGAGKTTLASGAIDDLRNRYAGSPNTNIVLYVYFRHDTLSLQKIPNVLASLLRQVVKKRKQVSEELQELYEEYSSNPKIVPAIDRMIKILQSELMAYRTTFIVVDALDEYSTETYSLSHALVTQLEHLNARLLITSRHHVDFTPNTFSSLNISAHAEDIRILIEQHVTGNLAKVIARTPSLLEEIVATVIAKAGGMFIIAKLLVDAIPDLLTSSDVRTALKMLPTGLRDTYLMTMERIQKQKPHIAELGKKTLSWIFLAKRWRRLGVRELQHAVSFRRKEVSLLGEDLIAEDLILSSCLGLVVFVEDGRGDLGCQFAHFTTKEFLNTFWQDYFPDGEKQVAETCLEYLTAVVSAIPSEITEYIIHASVFENDKDQEWQRHRTSKFALCPYAARYWVAHAKAIEEVLDLNAGAGFFKHAISPYIIDSGKTTIHPTTKMVPAHYWMLYFSRYGLLKCLQGFTSTLNALQNHDDAQIVSLEYNDIRDHAGRTALHFSARYDHPNIVEFLLESRADPNRRNYQGMGPLHSTALASDTSGIRAVQLLLNHGANVDQLDDWNRAPIFYAIACEQPSLEIIRLLLQHEVDIYRKGYGGNTPLSLAQESEHPEIKQLLEEYAHTHPPKRRMYDQAFPGDYFRSLNWEQQCTSDTGSSTQLMSTIASAPPISSKKEPLPSGCERTSALDSGGYEPPTQQVPETNSSRTSTTYAIALVDPELQTLMAQIVATERGRPRTKPELKQIWKGCMHSSHGKRPK